MKNEPLLFLLLVLAFFSGTCGISYEIIYAHLLNAYLGDMFYVAGAILSVFLLGIALGSFFTHRIWRYLWMIELGIGAYAAAFAVWFAFSPGFMITHVTSYAATGPDAVVILVFAFLAVPSFLIGASVPLFSLYLDAAGKTASERFTQVYLFYNLGAVLFILMIEFVLLRMIGARASLYCIAAVNVVIGLTLRAITPHIPEMRALPGRRAGWTSLIRVETGLLFLLSMLSGVYQLLFLKLVSFLFGPYKENFTLTVAVTLAMIVAGAALVRKGRLSFQRWLLIGAVAAPASFLMIGPLFRFWGFLAEPAGDTLSNLILSGAFNASFMLLVTGLFLTSACALGVSCFLLYSAKGKIPLPRGLVIGTCALLALTAVGVLLLLSGKNGIGAHAYDRDFVGKMMVMTLLGGPILLIFGGTIPSLFNTLPEHPQKAGFLLAVSSAANCLGYLLMVLVLDSRFSYHAIAVGISGVILGCAAVTSLRRPRKEVVRNISGLAAGTAALVMLTSLWPGDLLKMGSLALASQDNLRRALAYYHQSQEFKRFGYNVSVIESPATKERTLILDGYWSLNISDTLLGNAREAIVGVSPALYAPSLDDALVLGAGTGITASATADLFKSVDVVEINPIVIDEMLPMFAKPNQNLLERPNVKLHLQDGMVFMAHGDKKYDAIVNTVTTPLFFSSSKLYTRDFFRVVKSRLKPGGVYSTWFDSRVGDRGARIIFNTIRDNFRSCSFVFLSTVYVDVLCSDEPMKLRQVDWPPAFRSRFAEFSGSFDTQKFFEGISFSGDAIFSQDWRAPLNTFDRRTLEYAMSPREANHEHSDVFSWMAGGIGIAEKDAADKCLALRMLGDPSCINAYRNSHDGRHPEGYIKKARIFALQSTDWFKDVLSMADDLEKQEKPREALDLLNDFYAAHGRKLDSHRIRDMKLQLISGIFKLERQLGLKPPEEFLNAYFSVKPFSMGIKDYQVQTMPAGPQRDAIRNQRARMLHEIGKHEETSGQSAPSPAPQNASFYFYEAEAR